MSRPWWNSPHKSPSRKRATRRMVDPYRLHMVRGSLYLVAYCHKSNELRNFLVDRIRMAAHTGKHFDRVHEEDLAGFIGDQ